MTFDDLQKELEQSVQRTMGRFEDKQKDTTGIPKPFKIEVSETVFEPGKFKPDELRKTAADTDADKGVDDEQWPPGDEDDDTMHCGRFNDNPNTGNIMGTGSVSDGSLGNFWGGWYWPTYNHGKAIADDGFNASYFRHTCLRGIVVDYNRDTLATTVVSTHEVTIDGLKTASLSANFELGDEISWYFAPDSAALEELITKGVDFWDEAPPETGVVRFTIYMEMHREYAYIYATHIYPPDPPGHTEPGRNASRGGHALKSDYSSHWYNSGAVGTEEDSVPVVLKACWQVIS